MNRSILKTQISIMGCGWLGLPLATTLVDLGCTVKGSTTSDKKLAQLRAQNITPYLVELTPKTISASYPDFLTGSDTLIINIPPGLRKNPHKNHVAEIELLIPELEKQGLNHVLFISSTSVFEDETTCPVITVQTTPNAQSQSGKQLGAVEQLLLKNKNFKTSILRCGGLVDEQRHPGQFLSGKTNLTNPEAPINLVHKTDVIGIITAIIKQGLWGETFHAVYPKHPTKAAYYTAYCKANKLPLPSFKTNQNSKGKQIESTETRKALNYTFLVEP
ncbi:MAG: hypothetical protein ABJQ39_14010 [Winogradskyella arenosi]